MQWPPPSGAGNFAGEEVKDGDWPANWAVIAGYRDGYPRTSPVGQAGSGEAVAPRAPHPAATIENSIPAARSAPARRVPAGLTT